MSAPIGGRSFLEYAFVALVSSWTGVYTEEGRVRDFTKERTQFFLSNMKTAGVSRTFPQKGQTVNACELVVSDSAERVLYRDSNVEPPKSSFYYF